MIVPTAAVKVAQPRSPKAPQFSFWISNTPASSPTNRSLERSESTVFVTNGIWGNSLGEISPGEGALDNTTTDDDDDLENVVIDLNLEVVGFVKPVTACGWKTVEPENRSRESLPTTRRVLWKSTMTREVMLADRTDKATVL